MPRTIRPAARDLSTVDPSEWVGEQEFKRYANRHGLRAYQVVDSWRIADGLAKLHGGQAYTEHSGEGSSVFYQRGPGMVDVLGFMVLLPVDLGGYYEPAKASRIYWRGAPDWAEVHAASQAALKSQKATEAKAKTAQVVARRVTGAHISPKGSGLGKEARFTVTLYRALPSGNVASLSVEVQEVRCKVPAYQVETHGASTSLELRKPHPDGVRWEPQPIRARIAKEGGERVHAWGVDSPVRTVLILEVA